VNALTPATILKVVIDNDRHKLEIIVAADQLSGVLGRRGQNVRLASKLVGWGIDIMTDEQESKKRVSEFANITEKFMQALDVDEVLAQLLVSEGFNSIEQLSVVDIALLLNIDGFDTEIAQELKERAIIYMNNQQAKTLEQINILGVSPQLIEFLSILPLEDMLKLAEAGIKNIEDLSEISAVEFRKIINRRFNTEQITTILNAAKNKKE
jgi:N utilization substance protein A